MERMVIYWISWRRTLISSSFRIKKTVGDIRGWRILINVKGPVIFIGPEWGHFICRGVV